ncbi:phage late control D family protein [Massilia sp. S19_KUP03_FR1]|uniref:phage late control D family protein n=1 Tax=Massilia sp. S19_KUP03_FR1 TaxID=3025503 RepID=UPI002FCDAE83
MPDAPLALDSSRPTIAIDGRATPDLAAALLELRVEERSDGMARCELAFGCWGLTPGGSHGYTLYGRDRLEFGKRIEIKLRDARIFSGRVYAIAGRFPEAGSGEAELVVHAEDRLQDLRMTRRTRCFAQASDAAVARSIASAHGLSAKVDLSGPTYPMLAQVNQSDLAFLRERARAAGAEIWLVDEVLHLAPRPARAGGDSVALAYGSTLHGFDVRADLALQRTRLSVGGWDVRAKRALREEASASVLSGELDGGEGGSALLQRAFGERADSVAHLHPADAGEARALAESWMRQLGRRFVTGSGVAGPDARIKPGARVDLSGLGPVFNGKYTVTASCHRFDVREGARTEFDVERAAIGRA